MNTRGGIAIRRQTGVDTPYYLSNFMSSSLDVIVSRDASALTEATDAARSRPLHPDPPSALKVCNSTAL